MNHTVTITAADMTQVTDADLDGTHVRVEDLRGPFVASCACGWSSERQTWSEVAAATINHRHVHVAE